MACFKQDEHRLVFAGSACPSSRVRTALAAARTRGSLPAAAGRAQQERRRFRGPQVGEDLDGLDLHFRVGAGQDRQHRAGGL